MKKLVASILSAAMLITMAGCGDKSTSSDDGSQTSDASDASNTGDTGEWQAGYLANPVKKNEDGSIDMEAAFAYETDIEAFKEGLAEREVDLTLPVSLNARNNPNTMKVWEFLRSTYGNQIIAGQMQMDLSKTPEDKVYYNATEDLPALKGFDFIFTTIGEDGKNREFVDAALDWGTNSGGLVTFCWHWNVPRDVDNPDLGKAFYMERDGVKIENWDVLNATTPGTKEYEVVVHDIDLIASYLQELEEAGITVLWRPFHEASGSWFWWGAQVDDMRNKVAAEKYTRLWYMMFDRLENYHKLSNIIWVWNGQMSMLTVDPNSYDISGVDVYPSSENHTPLANEYKKLKNYTYDGKMLALTETGYIPDPDQCKEEDIMWLFYMPWNGDFIYEPVGPNSSVPIMDFYGTPNPNPERISNELLQQYFSSDVMVTWKDLPDKLGGEHEVPQALRVWIFNKSSADE